jgi:hypothetical protein
MTTVTEKQSELWRKHKVAASEEERREIERQIFELDKQKQHNIVEIPRGQ